MTPPRHRVQRKLVIEQHGVDLSTLVLNVESICGHQGGLAAAFADAARQIEAHDRPARTTLRGPRQAVTL